MTGSIPLYNVDASLFGLVVPGCQAGDWVATTYGQRTSVQAILPDQPEVILWPLQRPTNASEPVLLEQGRTGQPSDKHIALDPTVGPQSEDVRFFHVQMDRGLITTVESIDIYPHRTGNPHIRYFTVPFIEGEDGIRRFGAAIDGDKNGRETVDISVRLTSMRSNRVAWDRNLRTRVEQIENLDDPNTGRRSTTNPVLKQPSLELGVSAHSLDGLYFVRVRRPMRENVEAAEVDSWPLDNLTILDANSMDGKTVRQDFAFGGIFDTAASFTHREQMDDITEKFDELPYDRPVLKRTRTGTLALFFADIGFLDVFGVCSTNGKLWFEAPPGRGKVLEKSLFFRYFKPLVTPNMTDYFPMPTRYPPGLYDKSAIDHDANLLLSAIVDGVYAAKNYLLDAMAGLRASAFAMGRPAMNDMPLQTQQKAPIAAMAEALEGLNFTRQDDLARLDGPTQARLIELRLKEKLQFGPMLKLNFLDGVRAFSDGEIDGLGFVLNHEFLFPVLEVLVRDVTNLSDLNDKRTEIEKHILAIENDIAELSSLGMFEVATKEERREFLLLCIDAHNGAGTEPETETPLEGMTFHCEFIRAYVAKELYRRTTVKTNLSGVIVLFDDFLPGVAGASAARVLADASDLDASLGANGHAVGLLIEPDWSDCLNAQSVVDQRQTVSDLLKNLRREIIQVADDGILRSDKEKLRQALQLLETHERWLVHRRIWRSINNEFIARYHPAYQEEFDRFRILRSGPPQIWPQITIQLRAAIGVETLSA